MNDSTRGNPTPSRNHPRLSRAMMAVIALVTVAVLAIGATTIAWAIAQQNPAVDEGDDAGSDRAPNPSPQDDAASPAPGADATCPESTVEVASVEELESALEDAQPGDVIGLAPGRYTGEFVMTVDGEPDVPITLCGTSDSVLDGGGITGGYVVHLDGTAHWVLQGFAVENGQKGVMADATAGSVIRDLTVSDIGDEAIHLRAGSTDNQVLRNTISNTGLRKPKFGEGIYIGTAESNWCDISDCEPDASDRNLIEGNTISNTTSESVDIKEGTTDGILRGNSFDGAAMVEADSWVDVKGNGWLIEGNTGTESPADGFQTHEILDGWGTDNIFRRNTANLNGPGLGFSLKPERDNVVRCDNTVSGSGAELSNVECRD